MTDYGPERMTKDELVREVRRAIARVIDGSQLKPRLLNIEDSARYLGTSDKAVRCLIANGELPFIQKVPGRSPYRLDVADLDH